MTPRQRAAAAGELTYTGGAMCKYGHRAARYTSTGDCLECRKRPDATDAAPAPDPRLRDLSGKLHEVRAEERQAGARVKMAVRKFDAAPDDLKKWRASEAVGREHKTLEDLQRQAAGLELELAAARPAPDPLRLASLLAAAGAPSTPPPVRFDLLPPTKGQIEATRWRNCHDPDQVLYRAQMARDKMLRDEVKARMSVTHPGGWTSEESAAVLAQVKAEMGLTLLPTVEPDPRTEEQQALVDRLLKA